MDGHSAGRCPTREAGVRPRVNLVLFEAFLNSSTNRRAASVPEDEAVDFLGRFRLVFESLDKPEHSQKQCDVRQNVNQLTDYRGGDSH